MQVPEPLGQDPAHRVADLSRYADDLAAPGGGRRPPGVTNAEAWRVLELLDAAMEVFRAHGGALAAREIRLLSMVSVVRQELLDVIRERHGEALEPEAPAPDCSA